MYLDFEAKKILQVTLIILIFFFFFILCSFDVNNEDWISTISQAFEGFSDFKKLKK